MIKAFFIDFYGTVVYEDGEIIKKITQIIYNTGKVEDKSEIGAFWWNDFQSMFTNSYGDKFETQRVLEKKSLEHTLEKFCSTANADELSNYMFEHWIAPPIFEESKRFFSSSPIPIYREEQQKEVKTVFLFVRVKFLEHALGDIAGLLRVLGVVVRADLLCVLGREHRAAYHYLAVNVMLVKKRDSLFHAAERGGHQRGQPD